MIILWMVALFVLLNMVLAMGLANTMLVLVGVYLLLGYINSLHQEIKALQLQWASTQRELESCRDKLKEERRRKKKK